MADCRERIMSEEYGDYIVEFDGRGENAIEQYRDCLLYTSRCV